MGGGILATFTPFCIAGQPEEIGEQPRALKRQGLNAITFSAPLHKQYRICENFARQVVSRM